MHIQCAGIPHDIQHDYGSVTNFFIFTPLVLLWPAIQTIDDSVANICFPVTYQKLGLGVGLLNQPADAEEKVVNGQHLNV